MKVLNNDAETALMVANTVIDALEDANYHKAEENIPGLVAAIGMLAGETDDPGRALDEASDLLERVGQ